MLDKSPNTPPPPVAGAAPSDGSPRIGYVPAPGSNPMGAEMGISPGAGRPAGLELGDAGAGTVPSAGGAVGPGGTPVAPVAARVCSPVRLVRDAIFRTAGFGA